MAAAVTVHVSIGTPFATGEECPDCHFDSMVTVLMIIGTRPTFVSKCGREVCRKG
jgi:hypothetical protein